MYSIVNGTIRISVRDFVEFICLSGDIDNRRSGKSDKDAMRDGSRIHRKIQKKMGADYTPEVPLKIEIPFTNYSLLLEGRADGIIDNADGITIDEIKAMNANVLAFKEAYEIHKAQAKCYAFMYMNNNDIDKIKVQLTYCEIETELIKRFKYEYEKEELKEWFLGLVEAFKKWMDYLYEHSLSRTNSLKGMEFPFDYREGQRDLVVSVYRTIQRGKKLFIQAPTGVGKTISTIFPAVKAVGEGIAEKVFYLTAKTITATVAKDTFKQLQENGADYKVCALTAKEKLCTCDEMRCNPEGCPCAKGHYDRVNDAVYDLITHEELIDREVILQYALKHKVCPFEMSLDVTYWVDAVVGDYNYAFDPNVHLKRYFAEGVKGNYIFLVDEAHNLVDRARDMYSASLCKEDFLAIKNLVKNLDKKLANALEKCNKLLLEYKRECEDYMVIDNISVFIVALLKVFECLSAFDEIYHDFEYGEEVSKFYFEVRHFLNMYDCINNDYVIYCKYAQSDRFELKLFCVNPANNLDNYFSKAVSAVLFSATLLPINYYKKLLSTESEDYAIYAKTVFREEQRLLGIASDVSSRYKRRNEKEFKKVATYIESMVETKAGKYIVFFPSYKYMADVMEVCTFKEDTKLICQNANMNEKDREDFLNCFVEENEEKIVGFCVMGGIFSEGIDLKGDSLVGVAIVGPGIPQINIEQDILKRFYDDECGMGYEYAYVYPGMNKVLQAAGRVIRTTKDKGVILLMDDRFLTEQYLSLFPREWNSYKILTQLNIKDVLLNFWEYV